MAPAYVDPVVLQRRIDTLNWAQRQYNLAENRTIVAQDKYEEAVKQMDRLKGIALELEKLERHAAAEVDAANAAVQLQNHPAVPSGVLQRRKDELAFRQKRFEFATSRVYPAKENYERSIHEVDRLRALWLEFESIRVHLADEVKSAQEAVRVQRLPGR